ncbi:DUF2933 domain-containing protein [Vibrio sp. HN007]|uniref:DUF2933 domain-containing protein n=1 Tax=Vibrio iocasae TaxID=3098914 RepID=UPI0035D45D43
MKQRTPFWLTPTGWAAVALIIFVSYFLVMEHSEHLFPFLPYLILLLCPLIHFFMHNNHGRHHQVQDESSTPRSLEHNDNQNEKGD